MQLPGIYVEIKGDYTELEKNLKAAKALVTSQATSISNALNNALSPDKIRGGLDSLVKNFSQLERSSKVAGNSFYGVKTGLEELKKVAALTNEQWARLQERFLSTQTSNAQENALKRIAAAAGLTREEIGELGRQFSLADAQIDKVATSIHGAAKQVKSYADQIRALPKIPTVTNLSTGAQANVFSGYSGQYARMAEDLTVLSRAESLAGKAADAFANDLDELAKHAGLTEREIRDLQSRMEKSSVSSAQENALKRLGAQLKLSESEIASLGRKFGMTAQQIASVVQPAERAERAITKIGKEGEGEARPAWRIARYGCWKVFSF